MLESSWKSSILLLLLLLFMLLLRTAPNHPDTAPSVPATPAPVPPAPALSAPAPPSSPPKCVTPCLSTNTELSLPFCLQGGRHFVKDMSAVSGSFFALF